VKFQVGDIVLLLHSNEEGKIIDFINDNMAIIDVKGVSFPVYLDQIDFPYFKRFTEKKKPAPDRPKQYVDDLRKEKKAGEAREERKEDGVWLSFLPVMDTDEFGDEYVEKLKLHVLNRTSLSYTFNYSLTYFGKTDLAFRNEIHGFSDFYLHDIDFENLNDSPGFEFVFSLTEKDRKKAEYFESSVKLKPRQFFSRIETLRRNNEATFSQLLFEKYPDKIVEDKVELGPLAARGYKIYDAAKAREHLEPARSVVDLHIEKILDDWKGMSNHEILTLQLKTFEKFYHLAIAHLQPSLIVIHGVGEGRLREEIHERLRLKKEVKSFVNQFHPNFGFGATEIFFQY
jgi:hypothetical protein